MILIATIAVSLVPIQVPFAVSRTDTFEPSLPVLLEPVTSFGAAAIGDQLFLLGGHSGAAHDYTRENQSRRFMRLDLNSGGSWELLGLRERGLQSVALVANERDLFAVGGMEARNACEEAMDLWSIREARRFDPARGIWSPLPELPSERSSHAAAIADGRLWVVGGWKLAGTDLEGGGVLCDTSCSLDLAHPELGWASSPAPFQRRGLAAAATASRIAAIGGMEAKGKLSSRVDFLEVSTGAWTRGPDLPEEGFGCAAAAIGERIFAATPSGAIWELTPDRTAWKAIANLDFPRRFGQLVAQDEHTLIAVGGTNSGQRIAHVERVHLDRAPALVVKTIVTSTPAAARNRQTMWVRGDSLFLFGGNTGTVQHDFAPERFTSEGWKLDLGSLAWTRLADLPLRRQSLVALPIRDGKCVVAGGFGRSETGTSSFRDAFLYDGKLDRWQTADGLDVPRTQFGWLTHDGVSFVFGGMDFDDSRAKEARFSYPMDVLTRGENGYFRANGSTIQRRRRAFGSAVLGGSAYLVGGMADGFEPVEICDVYDFEQGSWSTIPSPSKPRISPELVALDGRLYLVGGSSEGDDSELHPDRSIECFDPETAAWSTPIADVGVDVQQLRAFEHRGRLLLVSTQHGPEEGVTLTWITLPSPSTTNEKTGSLPN